MRNGHLQARGTSGIVIMTPERVRWLGRFCRSGQVVFVSACTAAHFLTTMIVYRLYNWYIRMTRLNVSKAREEFPDVVNRAAYGKERTIVSRRGRDLAAVISMEDLRLLERLAR